MSVKLFRTPLTDKETTFNLSYSDSVLTMGSCFADRIGNRLINSKFRVCSNPFGVLFQPLAIENLIKRSLLQNNFTEEDFFEHQLLWKSFELHSCNNALTLDKAVFCANEKLEHLRFAIKEASVGIFTLGTAWVYKNTQNFTVASCHKMPKDEFVKRILSVEDIKKSLCSIYQMINDYNPNMRFLWTISPVRHLKDGFVENTRSKSHLIAALYQFLDEVSSKQNFYFPAYELLLDDLRDYRFYTEDMIHPSEEAIAYIWEYFKKNFWADNTINISKKIEAIQKGLQHRPFNKESESYAVFQDKLQLQIREITEQYSYIRFENTY